MAVGHVAALDVQVFKTILTYGADLVSDIDDEFGSLRPFFKSTTELAFLKQILDYDRSCEDIGAVAKVFPNPQKIAEAFKANRYGSVKDLISVVKGG